MNSHMPDSPVLIDSGSTTEEEDNEDVVMYTPPSVQQAAAILHRLTPDRFEVPDLARPANPVPPHSPMGSPVDRAAGEGSNVEGAVAPILFNVGDDPGGGQLAVEVEVEVGGTPVIIDIPNTSSNPLDSSRVEFKSPKKYKPKSPVKAPAAPVDVEDSTECPICFEEWSNSGEHRLSSLKCGHLFGKSCIEKWLREQKPGKCPQCKAKATKKDIRPLYAKTLKMLDTTERDDALKALETERKARRELEMEAAQARLRYQMAQEEMERLKRELERSRQQSQNIQMSQLPGVSASQGMSSSQGPSQSSKASYVFDRLVKVWDLGNCRVMTYDPRSLTLVVSQPSASPLFPGFGIKKINTLDFRTNQYVSIHQKMIRDVAFNQTTNDGLLLSASMDKTVKVTSMSSSTVVQTYQCPQPVWSCAWNPDSTTLFYAGQANGAVNVYDTRNTSEMVKQINVGAFSPVVSLQYIGADPQSTFRPGGLLVGQLNRSIFYEHKNNDEYVPHALPMENQLTCLSLDNKSRHVLASYRPTQNSPSTRHMVYQMSAEGVAGTDSICMANKIHTLHGGSTQKFLSRSKLIPHPNDRKRLLVCAGDEASHSINIWDTGTGSLCQKLSAQTEAILDFTAIPVNGAHYLAALTDKAVRLYRWSR